jgi:hypothetical protein
MRRGDAVALFLGPPELAQAALDSTLDAWSAAAKIRKGSSRRRATPPGCPRRDRAEILR